MIETWRQYTCDGCGETEHTATPDLTKAEVREFLKERGWKHFQGGLDYCPTCVKSGAAARRETSMND